MAESIFANFKINSPLKFILYVSAIVFIGSLFINIQGYNLNALQSISLRIMIIGVVCWFIKEILATIHDAISSDNYWNPILLFFYYFMDVAYIILAILIIHA